MSKVAVVYWSGTGNTQAMADMVAEGAKEKGAEVSVIEAGNFTPDQVSAYDGIAFGCPAMGDEVLEESEFDPMFTDVETVLSGKKIALFGSYGWGDGQWMRDWEERCQAAGAELAADSVIANDAPVSGEMKLGIMGRLFPALLSKAVWQYTAGALPDVDIRELRKRQKKEYKAMVARTPSVGSVKDNMFASVMYLACFGFSYYKADPEHITMDVFDGMINAICTSDVMKRAYKGKNCFDRKEIDRYVRGSERSKKRKYPMDWVFDFSYDLSVPEYYVTHRECGVCKIARQEGLMFLMPHICVMDYPTIEYKGGKLIRTKTLGAGDDCCDFHVVKKD